MKKAPAKNGQLTFYEYYASLDVKNRVGARNVVITYCGISYPGFYVKMRRKNFNLLEKKEIEKLFGMKFEWNDVI